MAFQAGTKCTSRVYGLPSSYTSLFADWVTNILNCLHLMDHCSWVYISLYLQGHYSSDINAMHIANADQYAPTPRLTLILNSSEVE